MIRSLLISAGSALALCVALATLYTPIAMAQGASEGLQLEEIVVTARKREESLLEIPVAVTAFSAQEIENAGFNSILDIAKGTPGLVFESFSSSPDRQDSVPFIRGVVFDNAFSPLRRTVSVFVDGVSVIGSAKGLSLDDLERVEVIKGPQSAQFGRASFAGAVNYVTKDPGQEFSGKLNLEAAARDEYAIGGSIEGGLGEYFAGRISTRYHNHGGHYRNAIVPGQDLGEEETTSYSATLLFKPNERFRAKLRTMYTELDDGVGASGFFDSTLNTAGLGGLETTYVGQLPSFISSDLGRNTSQADYDLIRGRLDAQAENLYLGGIPDRYGLEAETNRHSLDAAWDINDNLTVSALFGINDEESVALRDIDTSSDMVFAQIVGREYEDTTYEIRLAGSALDDRLQWLIGYSDVELEFRLNGGFAFLQFGGAPNDAFDLDQETSTQGIFGSVDYAFNDQWSVGFEARDQKDEILVKSGGRPGVEGAPVLGAPGEFSSFLPRVTVNFKPVESAMLYVSYSEGNLPGGFNSNFLTLTASQQDEVRQQIPGLGGTFNEETLENIELGWKQSFEKGSLAVALFRMQRTDQLATATALYTNPDFGTDPSEPEFESSTFSSNGAATDVEGVEVEGNWYPDENLSIRATIAYTNAEIAGFPPNGDSGDYFDVFGTHDGFIGTNAERFPEYQASFTGTYTAPLETGFFGDDSNWFLRGDLYWTDEYFLSPSNLGTVPPAVDANLRLGIRNERYTVEAYITNLFDEDAPTAGNHASDLSFNTQFGGPISPPPGRLPGVSTFGVNATIIGLRDKRQFGIRTVWNF